MILSYLVKYEHGQKQKKKGYGEDVMNPAQTNCALNCDAATLAFDPPTRTVNIEPLKLAHKFGPGPEPVAGNDGFKVFIMNAIGMIW